MSGDTHRVDMPGLAFDVPFVSSVDRIAVGHSFVAILAVFWFKAGMIPTLLACAIVYLFGLD